MQPNQTGMFFFVVVTALLLISMLGYRFLIGWSDFYRRRLFKYIFWILSLSATVLFFTARNIRRTGEYSELAVQSVVYGTSIWLVGLCVLVVMIPFLYTARRLLGRIRVKKDSVQNDDTSKRTPTISRRNFLGNAAICLPMTSWLVSGGGIIHGDYYISVQRHKLQYENLPARLEGYKIAQISDTHIGPFFSMDKLERVLRMVSAEKPDMLVITGDLIDDMDMLVPSMRKLQEFAVTLPQGVFYCLGNHEYIRNGVPAIRQQWQGRASMYLLENAAMKLFDGERQVYMLGVDYPWPRAKQKVHDTRAEMLQKATRGVPEDAFKIMLAHHPDFFDNCFEGGIELALAGHTHGGQIAVGGKSILPVTYKYMRGIYEQDGKIGYVNVGTGHWLPFRLGCPAEISVFTLQK